MNKKLECIFVFGQRFDQCVEYSNKLGTKLQILASNKKIASIK